MEHALEEAFSMPTDPADLRDRLGGLVLRAAERPRVHADHPVDRFGLEVELGVGELGRLRILEVFSVSWCAELSDLTVEVLDVDLGALEVRLCDSGARVRRGGGRGAFLFGAGGGRSLGLAHLELGECRAILARVLVSVAVLLWSGLPCVLAQWPG